MLLKQHTVFKNYLVKLEMFSHKLLRSTRCFSSMSCALTTTFQVLARQYIKKNPKLPKNPPTTPKKTKVPYGSLYIGNKFGISHYSKTLNNCSIFFLSIPNTGIKVWEIYSCKQGLSGNHYAVPNSAITTISFSILTLFRYENKLWKRKKPQTLN